MNNLRQNILISLLCLSLTACSGAITGDLSESHFRGEADELQDDCRPNDDDCVPGLTETLFKTLVKRAQEEALVNPQAAARVPQSATVPARAAVARTAPVAAAVNEAAPVASSSSTASDALTVSELVAIRNKPDALKTPRERKIEALLEEILLEELLRKRSERIASGNGA